MVYKRPIFLSTPGLQGLIYVPSGSDLPLGNPQNSVSFWQKWHTQIGLSEERVLVASSGRLFPKAFSFLAALWAFISNDGVFIVVMQQSFQSAVSAYRKRKGQDRERLKRDRFMLTVPTRNHIFMHALEKYG